MKSQTNRTRAVPFHYGIQNRYGRSVLYDVFRLVFGPNIGRLSECRDDKAWRDNNNRMASRISGMHYYVKQYKISKIEHAISYLTFITGLVS